ncbi:TauD/TfdA dioxygenase family protein [Streptosporangium roseum]|uniref:Alpha-ketoglutarate-dependent sulfate ester dioxygenase n=1 Tax=Streptosporangium roseum (strain ATCC 12428 / DSM 43021 / JCM 3005 / KCTC 9067 / NCIMB 10171 / NRRL 2505 / NI 9100) TaxID=479432 RepID=D2AV15_STRRD|nr:TauD/TfdA family dioxygenase [Streptosporangium roseum]ACZ86877.1 Taurine dioxygenase [Streptosporangium roseum DSM 43021]
MSSPVISPVAGRIGAEVSGVRLGGDLPAETVQEIRAALLRHKVIFFRGQEHLDERGQVAFAGLLGDLTTAHPTVPALNGNSSILDLDYSNGHKVDRWHTDVTFVDRPPLASVLRAVTVPPAGGDTLWANTVTAYENLPQELTRLVEGLRAVHTNQFDYARIATSDDPERTRKYAEVFTSTVFETEHPVVRVHPETGERSILLGDFAKRVVGLPADISATLIRLVQEQVTQVENTVRWRWSPGDVAIWDNRATQHRVVHDFGDQPRRLHRVTVTGDVPVGVDGRPSTVLSGDASAYSSPLAA